MPGFPPPAPTATDSAAGVVTRRRQRGLPLADPVGGTLDEPSRADERAGRPRRERPVRRPAFERRPATVAVGGPRHAAFDTPRGPCSHAAAAPAVRSRAPAAARTERADQRQRKP